MTQPQKFYINHLGVEEIVYGANKESVVEHFLKQKGITGRFERKLWRRQMHVNPYDVKW